MWWERAASPADPRPELPNLRVVELAFVACAQAMRRACRPGLRGRRQRRESLGMAQKKAGQAHCRLVARARSSRACQAARTRKVRPSLVQTLFLVCASPRQSAPLSCQCAVREACILRILLHAPAARLGDAQLLADPDAAVAVQRRRDDANQEPQPRRRRAHTARRRDQARGVRSRPYAGQVPERRQWLLRASGRRA